MINRKKEMIREYKEQKIEAGVFQIRNTINQKVFIDSTPNLRTLNGKKMQLDMGLHMNKALQKDLKEFGKDAFIIEVLEVLKKKEEGYFDAKDALNKLEEKWIEEVKPFGEKGYN